ANAMNTPLTPEDRAEIFGTDWDENWQAEAEERWGDSPQWKQSQERTAKLTKDDWKRIKAEGDALNADLAAAKRTGVDPGSAEAATLVERHRAMISTHYDCTHSMQVILARMYVQDPRFTEYYEQLEPGLAEWVDAAVSATARTHGLDRDTARWECSIQRRAGQPVGCPHQQMDSRGHPRPDRAHGRHHGRQLRSRPAGHGGAHDGRRPGRHGLPGHLPRRVRPSGPVAAGAGRGRRAGPGRP